MNSPRLNLNQRHSATECDAPAGFTGETAHQPPAGVQADFTGLDGVRTQSAHGEGQFPHTATSSGTRQLEGRVQREAELRSSIQTSALKVIVQSQTPAVPMGKEPGSSTSEQIGPGYSDDPVGRAQRRIDGLVKVRDTGKRIEVLTAIDEELAIEARATKSTVKLGRDFGKPEDRRWAGQWMHLHSVMEFVELYGVPKQTAYRWRHEYRRSQGLVK